MPFVACRRLHSAVENGLWRCFWRAVQQAKVSVFGRRAADSELPSGQVHSLTPDDENVCVKLRRTYSEQLEWGVKLAVTPSVLPGLPELAAELPSASRKRSTVTEVDTLLWFCLQAACSWCAR